MTETLANSAERDIHEDYHNILHFFVTEAQHQSDPEVQAVKEAANGNITPLIALRIAAIRTRARVVLLADAVHATKHHRPQIEQKLKGDPEDDEFKAYDALQAARDRGDFDHVHEDTRITGALQRVPEHGQAERDARLKGAGEALRDKAQSYRVAAYILYVLPHEKEASAETPQQQPSVPADVLRIPHQPSSPFDLVAQGA